MTDKEAIESLKKLKSFHNGSYGTAIDMAIKTLEQQPCEDCISILNRIMEYTYGMLTTEKFGLQHLIKSMMDDLPSVTPKARWISVSERLPEEDGCYLVTTTGTNNDIIDITYYTEGIWHKASRIKAWMQLPQLYKAESEGEE